MNDHITESSTTTKTFRFSSGQLLTLTDDQIEKIPYLTALVSAGPSFDSIKLSKGYYLLDSNINYRDFLFVLESISFHSIRKIFIRLPKNYNVLAIIALLDFLAIESERGPTLEEVDSKIFWNFQFGDKLGQYQFIYRPSDIQDMAVRFAIAMAKEEYDFTNRKVIDQVYWFIMFILSCYELFETNLRYHVQKIAQNCFSIFCPSLLECLYRLEQTTEKKIQATSITTSDHISNYRKILIFSTWSEPVNDCKCRYFDLDYLCTIRRLQLTFRCCDCSYWLPLWRSKRDSSFFSECRVRKSYTDNNLVPLYEKILEKMYKCFLETVVKQISMKINGHIFDELKYKLILYDILNSKPVQDAIDESILSEICEFTPKLEQKYAELRERIQFCEQNVTTLIDDEMWDSLMNLRFGTRESTLKGKQNEALKCEFTLNKLYQYESIIDETRNTILVDLHDLFMDEIKIFFDRWEYIWTLLNNLSLFQEKKKKVSELKKMHRTRSTTKYRPLPKIQCKYTIR
ncbi:unnamed protein product [Rotaria sp. Silwood1]|nr:unnamed protein product [Rotaria sp. Silwood1]